MRDNITYSFGALTYRTLNAEFKFEQMRILHLLFYFTTLKYGLQHLNSMISRDIFLILQIKGRFSFKIILKHKRKRSVRIFNESRSVFFAA